MILKRNSDFQFIFQNGQSVKNKYFSIYFTQGKELKIGFAAEKNCRTKVIRNRLKRIARELWRTTFRNFHLPAYIVMIVNLRLLTVRHKIRKDEMNKILSYVEMKLIKGNIAE